MFANDDAATGTPESASGTSDPDPKDASIELVDDGSDDQSDEQDLKAQLEEERRKNRQYLSEKTGFEEDRRKLKELEARPYQPPTVDLAQSQAERDAKEIQDEIKRLEILAGSDDPNTRAVANSNLRTIKAVDYQQKIINYQIALTAVDPEYRSAVDTEMRKGRIADIDTALEVVKLRKAATESSKKATDSTEAIEAKTAIKNAQPATVTRAVSSEEVGRRMKESNFDATIAALDPNDPSDWEKKRKLVQDRNSGKLKLIPG